MLVSLISAARCHPPFIGVLSSHCMRCSRQWGLGDALPAFAPISKPHVMARACDARYPKVRWRVIRRPLMLTDLQSPQVCVHRCACIHMCVCMCTHTLYQMLLSLRAFLQGGSSAILLCARVCLVHFGTGTFDSSALLCIHWMSSAASAISPLCGSVPAVVLPPCSCLSGLVLGLSHWLASFSSPSAWLLR